MPATVEWYGTATFRVDVDGRALFFDAYLDRNPGLDPVGLSTAEVDAADFVFVSHAHFDHLYGADAIALRTGATVVASPESARCLGAAGVPEAQLLIVTGAETVPAVTGSRCGCSRRCTRASSPTESGTVPSPAWAISTSAHKIASPPARPFSTWPLS